MDFSLDYDEEQEKFAKEVRAWIDENVPEDLALPWDSRDLLQEEWEKRRKIARKLGEKWWLYPDSPRQYGGGGLNAARTTVINREFAERILGVPPYYTNVMAVPGILAYGTEEQKRRFLTPIFKGEVITWQLFTEPEAGTDEANQHTNAVRDERDKEYFIVNGSKIFVGCLHSSPEETWLWLLARCDLAAPRHGNLAMFYIPATLPGITIQLLDLFTSASLSESTVSATQPGDKNSVFLDDVRIHKSYLIGEEREGWKVTTASLAVEHGDMSGPGGGEGGARDVASNSLVEKFLSRCKNDPNVVKRLRENPQLVDSVVNIYIGAEIQRLLSVRNAWLPGSGARIPHSGPQLALYSKMFGTRLIADMAKVLGPYALTDDAEWGLDSSIFELGQRGGLCLAPGGTPEALKILMSRALGIGR